MIIYDAVLVVKVDSQITYAKNLLNREKVKLFIF